LVVSVCSLDISAQGAVWDTLFVLTLLHRDFAANQAEWMGLLRKALQFLAPRCGAPAAVVLGVVKSLAGASTSDVPTA
jgi:hypothetical protein